MAIKMVRGPSDTPNIRNIDDIVPIRYAYGGQNGFVIGKGTEISNTVVGSNFTLNSGRLVLQGVECDIDATGVTITIDNVATQRYYTVYLEVNLALNTASIKSENDTAAYPTIDSGDDLTENTTGIARLPLYRFTAINGIVGDVNKVVESVQYINSSYIKEVKVNNSLKVNNLEIKQDNDGILKIDNIIIPQKKLLWSGDITLSFSGDELLDVSDVTGLTDFKNKTFEVSLYYYKVSGSIPIKTSAIVYKFKTSNNLISGDTEGFFFNLPYDYEEYTNAKIEVSDSKIIGSSMSGVHCTSIYQIIE